MDWFDIAAHASVPLGVGAGLGFCAATSFHLQTLPVFLIVLAISIAATAVASWIWTPREKAQHGGKLGGRQSQLEAYVPLAAGPVAFCVSLALTLLLT